MGQIRCDTAKKKGTEEMNDPYQVLGVSPNATDAEVKAAYRRLAKEYHPDRNGGSAEAEKKMMQINDAYTQIVEMRKNGSSYSYGGYSQGWGGSSQAQQQAPEFSNIRQMLQQYRWQEALQTLETMEPQCRMVLSVCPRPPGPGGRYRRIEFCAAGRQYGSE